MKPSPTERFDHSRKIGVRVWKTNTSVVGSYQAFVKLLIRWAASILEPLQNTFRHQMQTMLASLCRV